MPMATLAALVLAGVLYAQAAIVTLAFMIISSHS
jgi:hypothetical protein